MLGFSKKELSVCQPTPKLADSPAGFVDVFRTPDPGMPVAQARCYRIPSIAEVNGTILAFAEERGAGCGDNGIGHNVVL